MPDSLSYSVSSFYADDTEIYASSNNGDDLLDKVNFELQNIHKWMIENKLQTHSNKSTLVESDIFITYFIPIFSLFSPIFSVFFQKYDYFITIYQVS